MHKMLLWMNSEVIPGSMENLPWVFWGPKVNDVPNGIKGDAGFRIVRIFEYLLSEQICT